MKKFIAIATALTVAVMVAAPANALTTADLQAQIAQLTAQLAQLQAQLTGLGGQSTGVPANCAGITFNRNLARGMVGNDVKCLQSLLNQLNVNVADSGAGSPGNETTYFGGATRAAVIRFQELYRTEILTPLGLAAGTGYVGAGTRAKLNSLLAGWAIVNPPVDPPITGPGLTVTLASNTPVSGTIVDTQSIAPLARFSFANGNSAEVKVTQLKLKRIGVSADATLTNVYLFDGALRLTDAASVSSGVITFSDPNGIFAIGANSLKVITVSSDVDGTSGETMGVAVNAAADVVSTATAINGTFPLNGNLMTLATASLAAVQFSATTTPTDNSGLTPQNDYVVWQNSSVISTRAVDFTRISFREIGTINYADLQNFRLYANGVQVGATVANLDANGYITFDLSAAPTRLETGTRVIKLMADIIGGSSRTFYFSIRNSADANFIDTQYNVNIKPTTATGSTTFTVADVTAGVQTVSSGTITVVKATDSPSGNIVDGTPNATLAKYTLTAAGERVKIEHLTVRVIFTNVTGTDDCTASSTICTSATNFTLRNGMLLANGVQIGSTTSLSPAATGSEISLGSSLIVAPGSPVTLEIRGDIYDNIGTLGNDIDATDLLQISLIADTDNALGMISSTAPDVPASTTNANQLTVKAGALTLAKYTAYINQTMVPPLTAAKLGWFTLTADTTEAVNLNTFTVDFDNPTDAFDASSDLSNLYLVYGASASSCATPTTTVKSTPADSANAWSVNYALAAGQTVNVLVCSDVLSTATDGAGTSDQARASITVAAVSAASATSITTSETYGQVITFGAGSISSAIDPGQADQVVVGDQTITTAKFKLVAISETYTVKEVKLLLDSTAVSSLVTAATLWDGTTQILTTSGSPATASFDTTTTNANDTAYFTGLNIVVPSNSSKVLTAKLALSTPCGDADCTNITVGANVRTTLSWFRPYDTQGVEYTTGVGTDVNGKNIYVFKSIPTFTKLAVPAGQGSNLFNSTTTTLYRFKVEADAKGPVSLKQLKFSVVPTDHSGSGTSYLSTFKFFRGSTDISSLVTILGDDGVDLESTGTLSTDALVTEAVVTFATEEGISAGGSNEYSLKATPTAFVKHATSGSGDSVTTYLEGDAAVAAATSLFYAVDAATDGIFGLSATLSGSETAEKVIWSDNSAVAHDYTDAASSADWTNSIATNLSLPLDAEGIQAE